MISNEEPPYLSCEEQSSKLLQLPNSPESYDISSLSNRSFILADDFNQAYNDVFSNSKINEDDIEPEEVDEKSKLFGINNIKSIEESNIITESVKIVLFSVEKKAEKNIIFTEGKGIVKTMGKLGLTVTKSSKKYTLCEFKEKKFECKEMEKDEKGKIKAKKKRRKFKPDNIRKKIKARFHKDLKNNINQKLKKAGAIKLFDLMPQNFITNITIKLNKQALDTTFENLILHDSLEDTGGKEKNPDRDKFNRNLEVMKYLEKNKEISQKAEFDKIKKMTYEELLKIYFSSAEFENSLIELYEKNKNEKIDYVEDYINKAASYVDFFKNPPIKNWDKKKNSDDDNVDGCENDSSCE
jgi:hypothetical protein